MEGPLNYLRRRWAIVLPMYVLAWTIPGLITTTQLSISYGMRGDDPPLSLLLQIAMPGWYIWMCLAPIVALAAWRLPVPGPGWPVRAMAHLGLNAALAAAWVGLAVGVRSYFDLPGGREFAPQLVNAAGTSLLTYWVLVLAVHAVRWQTESRARERRALEVDAELQRARLQALTARLHPHFLFNTMHAISAFVRSDPAKAETMLAQLADLLRMLLDAPDEEVVPLEKELEFVEKYLALQRVRLQGRLDLRVTCEGDLSTASVPFLMVQPIAENAIEHGVASRRGPGAVAIECSVREGRVRIAVRDDGPGLPEGGIDDSRRRVGLATTTARLEVHYGEDHTFSVTDHPGGGVLALVEIPAQPGGLP